MTRLLVYKSVIRDRLLVSYYPTMMLKTVIAAALFALFGFAIAETANAAATNDLELANKGVECAGRCGSHHRRARCCGCPKKGSIFKVTKLNEILLDLFFTQNPQFSNLIDIANFEAYVQGGFEQGANFCCAEPLNYQQFLQWFLSFGSTGFYPIFPEGEHAYEKHSSGCIIVPFDLVTVGPGVTRAYQVKVTWCPSEGCNWLVSGIDIRSYACLNVTPFACPTTTS
jgi:hypothetical protein